MGEVFAGMAPTALTGQLGQPADTAGQPSLGDDTALTGQSSQQWLASMGIPSGKWRWSRSQPAPLTPTALPDQRGISLPGTSYLTGSQLSLMGVEPPPGFTGPPWGPENFQGRGKCQPWGSHTAPKAVITQNLSNRTMATIATIPCPP